MKTQLSLIILLLILTDVDAQVLFKDSNVLMSYEISRMNVKCVCINPQDDYYRRTVNVWKVEVKLKNLTNKKFIAKLNVIGDVEIRNWNKVVNATLNCDNSGFKHNLQSKNNLDNAHYVQISMGGNDTNIDSFETKSGYSYFEFIEGENPVIGRYNFGGYKIIEKKKPRLKEKEKKEDDFWSGKKDKKKTHTENNVKDDFWNGGKTNKKTEQKKKEDFWSGKGNQKDENYFKYNTKPKESNQFIGEIDSNTNYIKIVCKDHGSEDGDRVALLNNKVIVESNIYLTNSPKTFKVQLKWGMNRIDFKALNQGSAGPNTAKFDVFDDTGKLISTKEWNLLTGYIGTLLITKF